MEVGAQSLRTYVVQPQETAKAFESGDLEVLATPRLVGMFESVGSNPNARKYLGRRACRPEAFESYSSGADGGDNGNGYSH